MKLKKKIDKWVKNELITEEQGVNIIDFEKKYNKGLFGKTAATIAGILIGLGICLIVASNWDYTPTSLKILGSFGLLGAFSYNAYKNIVIKNDKLRELFLILSFLMVGATIGLFGQIFNLDGGWESFSTGWALLGTPYFLLSKSVRFNIAWGFLLFRIWKIYRYINIDGLFDVIMFTILFIILSIACKILDNKFGKFSKLPIGLSKLWMGMAYFFVLEAGFSWGYSDSYFGKKIIANFLVFGFLGGYMWFAIKQQNIDVLKRNTVLLEIYIFLLFVFHCRNLFMSGIGFILGGLAILGMIKVLKNTSKFIQKMEAFNE